MSQITSVIDRTVVSIERDMNHKPNNNNNNSNSMPGTQFASHPQHTPIAAVKQEGYSPSAHRRPSLRSNSTTPSSMVNGTEQVPVHRVAGMTNASYYNSPMTAPPTAYPQMGYANLTQSALSTPTTSSSSMQSSYITATEESAHHQYLYATSAAASAAAAQMAHDTPGSSPQATHNPMVAYNTQPAAAAPGPHQPPHHHHHHQQQQGPAGWMNGGPGTANGMAAAVQQQQQHVPNGTGTWHEWTSAIAMGVPPSSQGRYDAGAILTLNPGQRGSGDPGGGGGGGGIGGGEDPNAVVPVPAHGAQWSMMMTYHNPNQAGG